MKSLVGRRQVRPELRVAAYALCRDQDQVLLVRHVELTGARHWTLPGGGVEHGEDPYHTVIREVAEETGYVVEVEQLLGIHSARRMYPRGRWAVADHHSVRVIYTARVVGGTLRPEVGGTTDLAIWTPLEQFDQLEHNLAEVVDIALRLSAQRPPPGHL